MKRKLRKVLRQIGKCLLSICPVLSTLLLALFIAVGTYRYFLSLMHVDTFHLRPQAVLVFALLVALTIFSTTYCFKKKCVKHLAVVMSITAILLIIGSFLTLFTPVFDHLMLKVMFLRNPAICLQLKDPQAHLDSITKANMMSFCQSGHDLFLNAK